MAPFHMQLIQEIFMESVSHSKSLVLFQFHTSINLQMGNFEEEEKQIQPSYLFIKLFKDISDHPDQVDDQSEQNFTLRVFE